MFHVKFLEGCPVHQRYASPSALEVIPVTGEGEDARSISCSICSAWRVMFTMLCCRQPALPANKPSTWRIRFADRSTVIAIDINVTGTVIVIDINVTFTFIVIDISVTFTFIVIDIKQYWDELFRRW